MLKIILLLVLARYTSSFTPLSSFGALAEAGSLMITVSLRIRALEHRQPREVEKLCKTAVGKQEHYDKLK